jgi:hypothetical protein
VTAGRNCRAQWRLIAAYAAAGFGYIVPATFLPLIVKAGAASDFEIALAWPLFGIAAFCSTFIGGAVSNTTSVLRSWRWAQSVMAFGVAVAAFAPTVAGVIVSAVCVGGTFMVITMAAMVAGRTFGGTEPRRLIAVLTAAFAAGQLAGPLVAPFVMGEGRDFSPLLLVAAGALAAGAVLLPSASRPPIVSRTQKEI